MLVGIVAVDPSSPFTGGAILGDRIRMQTPGDGSRHLHSQYGYARIIWAVLRRPPRTSLRCWMRPDENPIIVETVGVGQDEIDIVKLADVSIVVLVPGMGDDVQALKAGHHGNRRHLRDQ